MIGHTLHGTGPARAIGLHGWFDDSHAFAPVLDALDPDLITIALMDYRGYGRSRSHDGPYNMATIATDALALADDLGWSNFALIGHSMGGKAALATAVRAPDRVDRICAISPVWASKAPFDEQGMAFFRSAAQSLDVRAAILDLTTGGRLPPVWSKRGAARSDEVIWRDAFAAYFESWALDHFEDEARGLRMPTLVIGGAHDAGVPEAWIRESWLSGLPHADLEILPEAGHYSMEECPLILASILTRFLCSR